MGKHTRRAFDFYPTTEGVTWVLLDNVQISGRVLEPCVGAGDMARVLNTVPSICSVITNDVNPLHLADYHSDAVMDSAECWASSYDWVVTNPPFNCGIQILQNAYERARIGVAFLLRLSFLEPTQRVNGRGKWLAEHAAELAHIIPLNPRPSFTVNGKTDSVTVAWFVWQKKHTGGTQVHFAMNWQQHGGDL